MQPYQLIYIAGYGRSGSTIMDILLDQEHNIVGVGELNNLFTSGWTNNEYCACGEKALECPFWNKIKIKWENEAEISLEEYLILQKKFIGFNSIPRLLVNKYFPAQEFKLFAKNTQKLYQIISEISGCAIIVDSSKLPTRLLALKASKIEFNILHIVKDGRKIKESLKRTLKKDLSGGVQNDIRPRSAFHTATRWFLFNFLIELFKGKSKYTLIKYEDLVGEDGADCIDKISAAFNIDLDTVKEAVYSQKVLKKGHTIAGSRLRMKPEIRLTRTTENEIKKRDWSKEDFIFNLLTFPLLKRYRYI